MKRFTSWADSSDDDSDYEGDEAPQQLVVQPESEPKPEPEPESEAIEETETMGEAESPVPVKKEFVYPENPPFTAYVGNLSFSIRDSQDLSHQVADVVKNKLGKEIMITRARVALDRQQNNKPKGYGYVEVETIEDLKTLMELAHTSTQLAGRAIKLDVAASQQNNNRNRSFQSRTSSSFSEIDGSQFRGGRYSNQDSSPRQRPSLKLKPRSSHGVNAAGPSRSNSGIFGDGKARDEKPSDGNAWERRSSTDGKGRERRSNTDGKDRGGGGGRGGRGPPSGGDRGKNDQYKKNRGKAEEGKKKQEKPKPPQTHPAQESIPNSSAPPTKKVLNKFAALDFDDSDEE